MKKATKSKSKNCVVEHAPTSVLRHKGLVRKLKPRGKSFAPGNTFGVRFKPGQSGNPGGRPKYAKISEATKAALALSPDEKVEPRTNAEVCAMAAVKEAKRGNIGAFTAIADRCEGKPVSTLDLQDSSADPLTELVRAMHELGPKLYGRPEGMPIRNKIAAQENDNEED